MLWKSELIPPHLPPKDFLERFLKLIFETTRKEQVAKKKKKKKKKFVEKFKLFSRKE